ncbi:MAG TPA: ATP phosphoribosyltransferase [Clostridiales bacterium]|jgi:ATP phosphoribosyltransferase|nr:ATP phosphoribosyltransferase [Clostridiales bacterium]
MLNIALPKGRLGEQAHELLTRACYGGGSLSDMGRKLVIESESAGVRYFLVKPSDVAIYVEHGAADLGIVGKDILEEDRPDVYELLDLKIGRCRMCVAAKKGFEDDGSSVLRVASKFTNIAERYYASLGREVDIIKLNGSIELAPLLGLSDVIVDIVESGKTLRDNDLTVIAEIMPISARLIANKVVYQFKSAEINELRDSLGVVTND